jgi:hypothetical protein
VYTVFALIHHGDRNRAPCKERREGVNRNRRGGAKGKAATIAPWMFLCAFGRLRGIFCGGLSCLVALCLVGNLTLLVAMYRRFICVECWGTSKVLLCRSMILCTLSLSMSCAKAFTNMHVMSLICCLRCHTVQMR